MAQWQGHQKHLRYEFVTNTGKITAEAIRKGTLLFSLALQSFIAVDSAFVVKEPTQIEGLMLEGVGTLGIATAPSNGWCVKGLDLLGHMKFKAWIAKLSIPNVLIGRFTTAGCLILR